MSLCEVRSHGDWCFILALFTESRWEKFEFDDPAWLHKQCCTRWISECSVSEFVYFDLVYHKLQLAVEMCLVLCISNPLESLMG